MSPKNILTKFTTAVNKLISEEYHFIFLTEKPTFPHENRLVGFLIPFGTKEKFLELVFILEI